MAGADTADDLIVPLGNRVYRYDWNAATGTLINGTMILDLPATPGPNHDGGVLVWDDVAGHLYAVIGDLNRNEGLTILVVEQNANLALDIGHWGYVLETGRIAVQGPAQQLHDDEAVRKAYLGF